jgi:hypothetical protein
MYGQVQSEGQIVLDNALAAFYSILESIISYCETVLPKVEDCGIKV